MRDISAQQATDEELVHRAKTGELAAFEMPAARYERRVYSLALRILRQEQDTEDVTQETFLSAMESLDGFREEASFATWLLRIATYAALKVLRKRKGLDTVSLEEQTEPPSGEGSISHPEFIADWRQSPEVLAQQNETQRLIKDALDRLDDKHRLVFLLRDVEGLSVSETAEALSLQRGQREGAPYAGAPPVA